jgi:hypothetical protein
MPEDAVHELADALRVLADSDELRNRAEDGLKLRQRRRRRKVVQVASTAY